MDYALTEQENLQYRLRTLEFKVDQIQKTLHDEVVTVNIQTGKINGSKRLAIYDKPYYSFERIPYALPPVGELRFKAPKPMTPWNHVMDCSWYGPKAVQRNQMDPVYIEGSEDCLLLNVYTNNLNPSTPRPVMVWVHSGGFFFGEANREWYGPDYFMQKDVILVTVQYRLGALGEYSARFLSFNDPTLDTPGNAGLKDLILALEWVKENAVTFGGNPECVTLCGESAGGAAVHFLMMSENARGLFHRTILQSGVATGDWSISTNRTYELAKNAGYQGENEEHNILKYLLNLTAEEIVEAESKCVQRNDRETFGFAPCVEPYLTSHTVVCKPVEELLSQAWSNAIPLMLGSNSLEGQFFKRSAVKNEAPILKSLETCVQYVPRNAAIRTDSPEAEEKGLRLRKIHVKRDQPTLDDFYEIISYSFYWHPIQKAIEARLKYSLKAASTYLYRFDFNSNKLINPFRLMRGGDCGVAHTDELSFLFSSVLAKPMERQSREYQCLQRMISLWTQFAETGNPNGAKIPGADIKWHSLLPVWDNVGGVDATPAPAAAYKCLNINDELTFIDLPEMEKLKVWKSLYEIHPTTAEITTKANYIADSSKSSV